MFEWTFGGAIRALWLEAQGQRWPFDHGSPRCALCGRRLWGRELGIIQFADEKLITLCNQHGGPDGRVMYDCTTGERITVPPEPGPALRRLRNWSTEVRYWTRAICRFLAGLPVLCWGWVLYKAQGWCRKWHERLWHNPTCR